MMRRIAAGTTQGPETHELREVAGILRRHRWLLLACPIVGAAAGFGFASRRTPAYEASAVIQVSARPASPTSPEANGTATDPSKLATEIQYLRTRSLVGEVVDSLRLQVQLLRPAGVSRSSVLARVDVGGSPRSARYRLTREADGRFRVEDEKTGAAIGTFAVGAPIALGGAQVVLAPGASEQSQIEIGVEPRPAAIRSVADRLQVEQPGSDVSLIEVSYRDSDPELAQSVPNALTARYLESRETQQKSQARSSARFLREQLDTVTRQLSGAEDRLRAYQEANRVVDPQMEATTQVSQLAQLQAERTQLDAQRASLSRLYDEVQRSATRERPGSPSPYRSLMGFPPLLQNETASQLLGSLAQLENQRSELATRRKPEDPDMQALNARIADIEQQLKGIVTTYMKGLNNQVSALDGSLGRYQSQLNAIPGKETEYARLSREPRVLQGTYELLQTRLKEAEIQEALDDAGIRVVDAADFPTDPQGPGAPLFMGGFAALGLLLGIAFVFAREYADPSIHTRADVQAAIGIPVLGMIPQADSVLPGQKKLLPLSNTRLLSDGGDRAQVARGGADLPPTPALYISADAPTPWSDAYNRLHTNIMFAQPDASMRTLLFTSALPGDGKTTTAVNFAVTLAQSGLRVLLIDADLRRGRVHDVFGTPSTPGLAELLSNSPVPGLLRSADLGSGKPLRYIAAGHMPANPVQLLGSANMRALVACVAKEYDRVIIDTPPLNLFPDAAALTPFVDGVIVVARAGETPFDALVDTAEQLRHSHTPVVGAVLNGIDFERDVSYDTSYRWYQYGKAYANTSGTS